MLSYKFSVVKFFSLNNNGFFLQHKTILNDLCSSEIPVIIILNYSNCIYIINYVHNNIGILGRRAV